MTGDTHYDLETLAELAEGLLDATAAQSIRDHLAVCDPCGELLADLAAVREVLAATPTPAMPMGVALRIDQAIAAEAEKRSAEVPDDVPDGVPDWERVIAGAPWERAAEPSTSPSPEPEPEPAREPVRLGVVTDDGTIVPAKRRGTAARRRRWAIPAVASAAAASVVVGSLALYSNLTITGTTASPSATQVTQPNADIATAAVVPEESHLAATAYKVTATDFNYSDQDLRGSLSEYFAPAPIRGGGGDDDKLTRCVSKVAARAGKKPFQVDQGYYQGQEALVMLFWKDRTANKVQVRVLSPECETLRKPAQARWE